MRNWMLGNRHNVYGLTSQMSLDRKLYFTIGLREQRVVATTAYVLTGVELRAALTNNDVPSKHFLTAKFFHAQSFGL